MKKITFILLAFIGTTAFAQESATSTGTATVNALVVSPISISQGTDLEFGRIIGNTAGGVVTVSTTDARTDNSDGDLLAPSTNVQAASFTVKAANTYSYNISIPSTTLTGGTGDAMAVSFTSSLGTANTETDGEGNTTTIPGSYSSAEGTGADQILLVGGALTVNPGQGEGAYTGTATVTVSYE
ncbi:DUF4402 domain-containing protein [Salegentibacter sp. F188]|uniref:DUF4402 domain-containing protein n=1 Tax=Autumnicola patrickiae TaxID=3075591 RepID=A0ABU3E2A9_9FLAO|nr:DUF4402 domain-containing protein [Salegentibacter sp. F188]MDT0690131.1 DUF4402 domain-containing protein [Salegentibacter sp. F188]